MRASKETATVALEDLQYLERQIRRKTSLLRDPGWQHVHKAIQDIAEFLNSAKRRLPTEAAIERDRKRKRSKV